MACVCGCGWGWESKWSLVKEVNVSIRSASFFFSIFCSSFFIHLFFLFFICVLLSSSSMFSLLFFSLSLSLSHPSYLRIIFLVHRHPSLLIFLLRFFLSEFLLLCLSISCRYSSSSSSSCSASWPFLLQLPKIFHHSSFPHFLSSSPLTNVLLFISYHVLHRTLIPHPSTTSCFSSSSFLGLICKFNVAYIEYVERYDKSKKAISYFTCSVFPSSLSTFSISSVYLLLVLAHFFSFLFSFFCLRFHGLDF